MICGYPADRFLVSKNAPTKYQMYENSGKCYISQYSNTLDYEMYTYLGMSGSPIFYTNCSGSYAVGVHYGRIPGEQMKTGGCLLYASRIEEYKLQNLKKIKIMPKYR